MSTVGTEAEAETPASEQGPPALEPPMTSTQHQPNTAVSRSPTGTHVSENTSPEGESIPAGMQELSAASSAVLAVTRDASTAHSQVPWRGRCVGFDSEIVDDTSSLCMQTLTLRLCPSFSSPLGDGGTVVQRAQREEASRDPEGGKGIIELYRGGRQGERVKAWSIICSTPPHCVNKKMHI